MPDSHEPMHRTVRIRLETYRRIKLIAAKRGVTMVALIDGWVSNAEAKDEKQAAGNTKAPAKHNRG